MIIACFSYAFFFTLHTEQNFIAMEKWLYLIVMSAQCSRSNICTQQLCITRSRDCVNIILCSSGMMWYKKNQLMTCSHCGILPYLYYYSCSLQLHDDHAVLYIIPWPWHAVPALGTPYLYNYYGKRQLDPPARMAWQYCIMLWSTVVRN